MEEEEEKEEKGVSVCELYGSIFSRKNTLY
jgi:hypothetical protein